MRVVGEAVTPPVGDVGRFGKGALLDYRSAHYVVPGAPAADTLLVRTVPGVDPMAVGRSLARKLGDLDIELSQPVKPNDLVNFGRVQNFPLFLALLVALVIGLPLGIAAGRWVWTSFADNLGILPSPAIPLTAVLLMVPAIVLL